MFHSYGDPLGQILPATRIDSLESYQNLRGSALLYSHCKPKRIV